VQLEQERNSRFQELSETHRRRLPKIHFVRRSRGQDFKQSLSVIPTQNFMAIEKLNHQFID
jgi:hypothetical protein